MLLFFILLLAGCSSPPTVSRETANAEGWAWGLNVDSGAIVCEKGITAQKIGFKPKGSKSTYPLSSNALAEAMTRGSESNYSLTSLREIWDGQTPFLPFLNAAWRACGHAQGASEYEIETLLDDNYQPR